MQRSEHLTRQTVSKQREGDAFLPGFAVVDIGTTGLHPAYGERIVEIAVVHASERGTVTASWDTLVNPQRELPARPRHGVAAGEIVGAPTFEQIAGQLVELLQGRVLVAHDHRFVARFLDAEFRRCGYAVPVLGMCTMGLGLHLVGPSRSLIACCHCFGIEIPDGYRSTAARATAQLVAGYRAMEPNATHWRVAATQARASRWPRIAGGKVPRRPREVEPSEHFLSTLVHRLPDPELPESTSAYLATIDRALLDRHLSVSEANALTAIADELGVGRLEASSLHTLYLRQLAAAAWADGEILEENRIDLHLVGHLLGATTVYVDNALAEAAPREHPLPVPPQSTAKPVLAWPRRRGSVV